MTLQNACLSIAGSKAVSLISELGLPPVPPEQIEDKVNDVGFNLRIGWRHMKKEFVAAAWQRNEARLKAVNCAGDSVQRHRRKFVGFSFCCFRSGRTEDTGGRDRKSIV